MANYQVSSIVTKETKTVQAKTAKQALEKTFGKNLYQSTFVDGFLTRFLDYQGAVKFDARVVGK